MSVDDEPTFPQQLNTDARGQTSLHVRRILEEPSEESWLWLVERLTPLLEAQVKYRLPAHMSRVCDPQDLINEAWIVTFMRLHTLTARNGRYTPVLLRFLSSTLLNKINELLRREVRRRGMNSAVGTVAAGAVRAQDVEQRVTSIFSKAARSEAMRLLRSSLDELSPGEREVVVLRGVEQLSNVEAARQLGERPGTVAMRWSRALQKLRDKLPRSLFDDLAGETLS